MFKEGDIVRVIQPSTMTSLLKEGDVLVVRSLCSDSEIIVETFTGEVVGTWYARRFELVRRPEFKKPRRYQDREYINAVPTR